MRMSFGRERFFFVARAAAAPEPEVAAVPEAAPEPEMLEAPEAALEPEAGPDLLGR